MLASGGPRASQPGTLNQLFFDAIAKYDKPDAMQVKVNGRYEPISSRTLAARVRNVAFGLQELEVRRGDRIAILSENRPEWGIADYACLHIGATDVPIYPTLPAEQMPYLLEDSGAVIAFASTAEQCAKLQSIRAQVPALRTVIAFTTDVVPGADMTLADLERLGAASATAEREAAYRRDALTVQPDDLATIIYTSGTTGSPKGVMLTHDNIYSNVLASVQSVPFDWGSEVCLSFLPLSHIFERNGGHYMMLHTGTSIAFAESIDTVPANLGEVRPTIVLSVPRLYEKMFARVLENALSGGAVKKRIFFWARRVADRWASEKLAGREPGGLLAWQYGIAQKLVFSKLKERTGGRLKFFVSGGAPLAPEINKFFYAAGLMILEGYGLTETSPVIAVNTPTHFGIGTVGRPINGVEVKIAEDGEILSKGPHIMKGYYNKPDATAEVIDADGWFHTGDIGELRNGMLAITDRKKDIIVTAGGKNIAPQPIENALKTNKYVSQAVMIGDKRKYPVVLVVPNFDNLQKWAAHKNLVYTDHASLIALPLTQAKMEKEIFGKLESAGLAKFEIPKKVGLLPKDFSIDDGELTPKLSVKRRVVDARYKALIDGLYVDDRETASV